MRAFIIDLLADVSDASGQNTWENSVSLDNDAVSSLDTTTAYNNVEKLRHLLKTNTTESGWKRGPRGELNPMNSNRKFMTYLPPFNTQLSSFWIRRYKAEVVAQNLKMDNLVSISWGKPDYDSDTHHMKDALYNVLWFYIMALRCPKNRHYYVALTSEVFGKFVGRCIGTFSDSYLLHSHCMMLNLTSFFKYSALGMVRDSKEELGKSIFVLESFVWEDNFANSMEEGDDRCDEQVDEGDWLWL